METSEKERIRVLNRRAVPGQPITTMTYHGQLYFAEKARRPVRRGDFMIITDQVFPVCKYTEVDPFNKWSFNRASRWEANLDRLLELSNQAQAEYERRQEEISYELEHNLKEVHEVFSTKADDGSWRPDAAK